MAGSLSITLYADSDGFITYECPFCGSPFKLSAGDLNDEEFPIDELFCPYCGLVDTPAHFLSTKVVEEAEIRARNYIIGMMNKEFGKMAKDINRKKGPISMKFKPSPMEPTREVEDMDSPETIFRCGRCEKEVKIQSNVGLAKAYCPYCGVDL